MTGDVRVIGIDPGPVPGFVVLGVEPGADGGRGWVRSAELLQCTAGLAPRLLESLLAEHPWSETYVQLERFVVGRRSSRSSTASAGATTRDLVGALAEVVVSVQHTANHAEVHLYQAAAGEVKPWATDDRLAAVLPGAGRGPSLLELTKGMRHARDAARHATYAAARNRLIADPISRAAAR